MTDRVVQVEGVARPSAARALGKIFRAKLSESACANQSELARLSGYGASTVSALFTAQRPVPWKTVESIARTLDSDPGWLKRVETAWRRAKAAWAADRPELGYDQPELTPLVQELVLAQHRAADELPYRLLVEQSPPLSALYVEQLIDNDVPTVPVDQVREPLGLVPALQEHRHIVVSADAGGGKSTALHHIVAESAAWWTTPPDLRTPIPPCGWVVPVRVKAKILATSVVSAAVAETVAADLAAYLDEPIGDEVFRQSPGAQLQWLLLVDGIDEILDSTQRQRVVGALARRIDESQQKIRFAIASRPLSNGEISVLRSAGASAFALRPFDRGQQLAFARKWFEARHDPAPQDKANRFIRAIEDSGLGTVMRLPLLATIGVIVFESSTDGMLPTSRAALYRQFFHYLLDVRQQYTDTRYDLVRELRRYRNGQLTAEWLFDQIETLLEHAAELHMKDAAGATAGALRGNVHLDRVTDLARSQSPFAIDTIPNIAEWLRTLLIGSGVFRAVGKELEFAHQSYAEYLASGPLARRVLGNGLTPDALSKLTSGLVLDSTREVTLYALGRWVDNGNDSRPLVDYLLAVSARHVLLAAALITGRICPDPAAEAMVCARLAGLIADHQFGVAALNALAALPNQAAATAVLSDLVDPHLPVPAALTLSQLLHHRQQGEAARSVLEALSTRSDADPIDLALICDSIGDRDQAIGLLDAVTAKILEQVPRHADKWPDTVASALPRKLIDAAERIGHDSGIRAIAEAIFEVGDLHPDFARACVRLTRHGFAPAASFAAVDEALDWDERLHALRLTDYELDHYDWRKLAILLEENRPPSSFWRGIEEDGRAACFARNIHNAIIDLDIEFEYRFFDLMEIAANFRELGADDDARALILHAIESFSPDGVALTPREEIEYLADWLGVAATSALITEIVTGRWVNTDARLSAAVGMLEVGLVNGVAFPARDLLVSAIGHQHAPMIDEFIEYQLANPGSDDAVAVYGQLRLLW